MTAGNAEAAAGGLRVEPRPAQAPHATRLRFEVWVWRHGWAWPVSGLLLLLATSLAGLSWSDRRDAAHAAQVAAAKNDLLARRVREAGAKAAVEPGQAQLEAALRDAPGQVLGASTLLDLARQQGIAVAQGHYTLAPSNGIGVEETQVQFRFRASYPQTRRFVEAALLRLPTLSVERISISRESLAYATPEVTIGMTLHRDPNRPGNAAAAAGVAAESGAPAARLRWPTGRAELLRDGVAAGPEVRTADLFAAAAPALARSPRPPAMQATAPATVAPMPVPNTPARLAPRLQFQGKQLDERGWQVFLQSGDQTLIVREGQSIDNEYRVRTIKPPRMTLEHLGGGEALEIQIGEGS